MKSKAIQYFLAYVPPVFWAGVIYYLSAQSVLAGFDVSLYDFIFKKVAHISVYAVLYFLLFRAALTTTAPSQKSLHLWLPLSLSFLYAVVDELHQSTVPGRHPSFRDVGYDMLGVALMWLKIFRYI